MNAVVIHNPLRTDRMEKLSGELRSFFGEEEVRFSPAVTSYLDHHDQRVERHPAACIHRAHIDAVAGMPPGDLIVMEDDVRFFEGSRALFDELMREAPADWDFLLGGIYTGRLLGPDRRGWRRIDGDFSGTHFYVMNGGVRGRFLSSVPDRTLHVDKYIARNYRCYVAWPMLAVQWPGYSDQKGRNMYYDHLLSRYRTL